MLSSCLSYTVYLDMGNNNLTGSLPSNWGVGLGQLQSVFLDKNNLQGSIPTTVGDLIHLRK